MKIFNIIILLISSVFVGCSSVYYHKVLNTGEEMLSDVTVSSGEKSFNHGFLSKNSDSGYSGSLKISKNQIITISWLKSGGGNYIKNILLEKNPNSAGIIFEIDGQEVVVKYAD